MTGHTHLRAHSPQATGTPWRWHGAFFAVLCVLVLLLALQLLRAQGEARTASSREEATRAGALAAGLVEARARGALEAEMANIRQRLEDAPEREGALRLTHAGQAVHLAVLYQGHQRLFPPEDMARATPLEAARMAAFQPLLERLRAAPPGTPIFGTAQGHAHLGACQGFERQEQLCLILGEEPSSAVLDAALATRLPGSARFEALTDETGTLRWGSLAAGEDVMLPAPLIGWRLRVATAPVGFSWAQAVPLTLLAGLAGVLGLLWRAMSREARRAHERSLRAQAAERLSHDLRTPLANLRLYAAIIAAARPSDEALQGQCGVLDAEVGRLSRLAETLIAAARGEPDSVPAPDTETADAAISRTLSRFAPLMESTDNEVAFTPCGSVAPLREGAGFERCLINLIDNLCRHAPGLSANLTARTKGHFVVLTLEHPRPASPDKTGHGNSGFGKSGFGKSGHGMGLGILEALAQDAGGAFEDASDAHLMRFALRWPLEEV